MQRHLRRLAIGAVLASAAHAQLTHVIPNGLATTEGNTSNAFPWGRGSAASLQIQTIYDSSNFTAANINFPILISRLRYRLNTGVASTAGAYSQATVEMASATVDALTPSTSFNANMGPDRMLVYSGPVQVNAMTANTPGTFGFVDIPLSTPFLYDPTSGNDLVIFSDIPPGVGAGVTARQMDVQSTNSLSSRVFNSTAYGSGVGTVTLNHGVVVEVSYVPSTGYAYAVPYGDGCIRRIGTVHELFAPGTFDLANSSMSLLPVGATEYVGLSGVAAWIAPTAAATRLPLSNDGETTVTLAGPFSYPGGSTTQLTVCSNGYVSVLPGNGTGATPTTGGFLGFPQTCWASWHDYDPAAAGGGPVVFEEVGGLSIVTWDGVFDARTTTPNRFQLQFDRGTGAVNWVWQTMSGGGNEHLVGFKCGGPVVLAQSMDLSALLPSSITAGCDVLPVTLGANARPVLGTTFDLVTSRIPAGSPATVCRLALLAQLPPVALDSLGAPGCFAHVDTMGPDNALVLGAPTAMRRVTLPATPAFAGIRLYAQSASFVPAANPLGLLTSNGLDLRVEAN